MSYKAYTYLTDLIRGLQNLLLSYGSYSYAKVPVGTISRNRSDLCRYISDMDISPYHIRITTDTYTGFIQIQNISNNKEIIGLNHNHIQSYTYSEVPIGTTGLILILRNLTYFTDTRVPVVLQNLYLFYGYESTLRYYWTYTCSDHYPELARRYP